MVLNASKSVALEMDIKLSIWYTSRRMQEKNQNM